MVVVCHCPPLFGPRFLNAALAVDFFFCLSGFVIANAYSERLQTGLSPSRFLALRLIRLYPLYLFGTALGIAAAGLGLRFAWETTPSSQLVIAVPAALAMLPTLGGPVLYLYNPPAWSLAFELVANALYGVSHRFRSTPLLIGAIVLSSAVLLTLVVVRIGTVDLGYQNDTLALGGIPRVVFSFTVGVGIHALTLRVPCPWRVGALPLLLVLATILAIPDHEMFRVPYQLGSVLIAFPVITYLGTAAALPARIVGIFSFLGSTSYAVYAVHWPLYQLVDRGSARYLSLELSTFAPWSGFVFLGLLMTLAHLAERFYDRPVRRLVSSMAGLSAKQLKSR